MRVISGRFRGRRLLGPAGMEMRPTGDRLKQTLFDIIGSRVQGSVFLDVFAGSGAIGLEALSRGAREIVFVESSAVACRLIRRNLELCHVSAGCRLIQKDAFTALRSLGREGFHPDIAFLDPPYDWEPYRDLLDILFRRGIAGKDSSVVIEHHRKAALPKDGEAYCLVRTVRQGDQCLSFYIVDCGFRIAN